MGVPKGKGQAAEDEARVCEGDAAPHGEHSQPERFIAVSGPIPCYFSDIFCYGAAG